MTGKNKELIDRIYNNDQRQPLIDLIEFIKSLDPPKERVGFGMHPLTRYDVKI